MKQVINVIGVVATDPTENYLDDNQYVCRFRLASTVRGFDKELSEWVDKFTNWFSVSVFGGLGQNVKNSISKGERIVLQGRLRVKDWKTEEKSGTSVEIIADAIGHDLKWGISNFQKIENSNNGIEYDEENF